MPVNPIDSQQSVLAEKAERLAEEAAVLGAAQEVTEAAKQVDTKEQILEELDETADALLIVIVKVKQEAKKAKEAAETLLEEAQAAAEQVYEKGQILAKLTELEVELGELLTAIVTAKETLLEEAQAATEAAIEAAIDAINSLQSEQIDSTEAAIDSLITEQIDSKEAKEILLGVAQAAIKAATEAENSALGVPTAAERQESDTEEALSDEEGRVSSGLSDTEEALSDEEGRVSSGLSDTEEALSDEEGRVSSGLSDTEEALSDEEGRVSSGLSDIEESDELYSAAEAARVAKEAAEEASPQPAASDEELDEESDIEESAEKTLEALKEEFRNAVLSDDLKKVQGFIRQNRSELNFDEIINAQIFGNDNEKKTALMIAADKNNLNLFKLLLKHGADFNKKNAKGQTALDYVEKQSNQDMIDLLKMPKARLSFWSMALFGTASGLLEGFKNLPLVQGIIGKYHDWVFLALVILTGISAHFFAGDCINLYEWNQNRSKEDKSLKLNWKHMTRALFLPVVFKKEEEDLINNWHQNLPEII